MSSLQQDEFLNIHLQIIILKRNFSKSCDTQNYFFSIFTEISIFYCRSKRPCGLRVCSNPAEGMDVSSLMFAVFCVDRSFCEELICRSGEPYRACVCVCVCVCIALCVIERPQHASDLNPTWVLATERKNNFLFIKLRLCKDLRN